MHMTNSAKVQKIDKASRNPVLASVNEEKQLPIAVFKNSLLEWRARRKAENTTQDSTFETESNQTGPA